MATAQQIISTRARRRVTLRAIVVLAVVAGVALAWFWRPLGVYATASASYGARVACACRFIAGRPLSECGKDISPQGRWVWLGEDGEERSVTARFLMLARQKATYRPGEGCALEPWGR